MKLFESIKKSPLGLVTITLKTGEKITVNVHKDLVLTENTLQTSIQQQPALYTYISVLYKRAVAEYDRVEIESQRVMGRLFKNIKTSKESEYYKSHYKSPSDDLVMNMVQCNPKYIHALEMKTEAKENMMILSSLVKGFEQKADMIQTLSANLRREK